MKFRITVKDETKESGVATYTLNADLVFTKKHGLYLVNQKQDVWHVFSTGTWVSVEVGNYDTAKQSKNITSRVIVDMDEYLVTGVEFDAEGAVTLSIYSETGQAENTQRVNEWLRIFPPGGYSYIKREKLRS